MHRGDNSRPHHPYFSKMVTEKEKKLLKKYKVKLADYEGFDFKTDVPILKALYFVSRIPKNEYKGQEDMYYEGYCMRLDGELTMVPLRQIKNYFRINREDLRLFEEIQKEKWGG
jgi:hypothetical protein